MTPAEADGLASSRNGTDLVALARAVCAAPRGLLIFAGSGWLGAEGIEASDLDHILLTAQGAEDPTGFFEARWDEHYCGGIAFPNGLGVLCVLDDRARAPLTEGQRDLLRALGNHALERHEMHQALARMRPLDHVARGIAHDMNNALQTIVGALNTVNKLIETDSLERTPRFLAAAMRSAQRAGELTGSLQRLARREPGRSSAVEIHSLIGSLEDLFRRIVGEQITVRTRLAASPAVVDCDPNELEKTLLTLALEAAESLRDRGEILISTRTDARHVWVCVQERCLGLPVHPAQGG